MTDQPIDLLPCPFCGSDDLERIGDEYFVSCNRCDAKGPSALDPVESGSGLWNTRTYPTPDSIGREDCPWKCKADSKECLCAQPETVQPITPASEAYQKVKTTMEKSIELQYSGRARELAEEALAALPAMMPVAPSEMRFIDYDEVMKAGDAALIEYWDKKAGKYSDADLPSRYEWLAIFARISPHLRPSPQVDIEAGAIALSQWVYGANHGKPSWDRLSEEHRNEYREQAKACARAWGLKWE